MADDTRLIEAAMVLRANATEGWEQFTAAVANYAALSTADMLRCDPTQLQKQQGVALGLTQLANILENAPKLYEVRKR